MTYPLIGNYGRLAGRRPVDPAVAPGACRGQRHGGGPRRCPAARGAPPRQRHPGHRGRRYACARPASAGQRLPARHRHRARRDRPRGRGRGRPSVARWEDQDFVGQVSPSAIMDYAARARARPADRRSWISDSSPTSSGRCASAGPASASCPTPRRSVVLSPDIDGLILSPGPGDPARLEAPCRWRTRSSTPAGRCSGSASATRSSAGPPGPTRRGSPSGITGRTIPVRDLELGLVQVTAQNHEVQVVGASLPERLRLPGQPGQPQRRLGRRSAPPRAPDRDRPVPPRRAPRARSTPWRSSTGSWRRIGRRAARR